MKRPDFKRWVGPPRTWLPTLLMLILNPVGLGLICLGVAIALLAQ